MNIHKGHGRHFKARGLLFATFGGVLEGAIIDGAKNLRLQQEVPETGRSGSDVARSLLNTTSGGIVLLLRSNQPRVSTAEARQKFAQVCPFVL
jgi:hypothetical protein